MAAVKGSKQYQMVVVPHRPVYKALIFMSFLVSLVMFSWLTYQYGISQGMALKVEVVKERDQISAELDEANQRLSEMGQKIADLEIGGVIDERANEEVQQTIEFLQDQIAQQNEEISFYKGVMLPNVANKGLRIERLNVTPNSTGRIKYSLLLTQVVDKHDYVQGNVEILLKGEEGAAEKSLQLSQLDREKTDEVRFRFRYFQNINGEMMIPEGFEPREFMVVAQSAGSNGQRLQKSFEWPFNGG